MWTRWVSVSLALGAVAYGLGYWSGSSASNRACAESEEEAYQQGLLRCARAPSRRR
jgi:hypothetical protein